VLAEINQVLNFANETILKHRIQRNSSFDRLFPGTDFLGCFRQGLPDGIGIKSQVGYILERLGMKNVGTFYDHSVYVFYSNFVYFIATW
jgi:hypothetical protein